MHTDSETERGTTKHGGYIASQSTAYREQTLDVSRRLKVDHSGIGNNFFYLNSTKYDIIYSNVICICKNAIKFQKRNIIYAKI